ncbi:MAG: DMT family transporter [Rhodospirillales bacterium]|nr:DMT family transporter [Alphaproteobacteria bacterium]USO05540.1 MAG: DMT family transporter [Rhodospirillales bacterium]
MNDAKPTKTKIPPHQDKILHGVAFACTAFFCFTVMSAMNKLLTGQHHVMEIVFYRNLLAIIPCCAYIVITHKYHLLKTGQPFTLALRVTIGTIGLYLTFAAVQELPMANATVLFFMSTLLIPVLAHFFLKEYIGIHRWIAVAIGLTGVIIVAQPSPNVTAIGVTMALGAATCHGCMQVLLRALKSQNAFTITFYFFVGGVIVPGLFMPWVATTPTPESAFVMLGIGISGGLGQLFLTLAFQRAPASLLGPFNYTGLIWATGFDIWIWHIAPGWPVFIGTAIIIASNLYILHREHKKL